MKARSIFSPDVRGVGLGGVVCAPCGSCQKESAGGSAAERLKAATGEGGSAASGRLLIQPDPEEAAREILAYLRQIGVLAAAGAAKPKT